MKDITCIFEVMLQRTFIDLFIVSYYLHFVLLQHCTLKNICNCSNVVQIQSKFQCYNWVEF